MRSVAYLIHMCAMAHSYVWHISFICVTWLNIRDMTHSYVRYDSFIFVTWLVHMCDMTQSYVWWLIHMYDMTQSYVWHHVYGWHDSFICMTRLIPMCDMNHSYMRHDSFISVTWLIHMCEHDTTHFHAWHDSHVYAWHASFKSHTWTIPVTHMHAPWLNHMHHTTIHMHDMTHSYVWHDSFIRVTWLIHMCDMSLVCMLHSNHFSWWVLQHCTGFARLVWGRLRVHRAFVYSDWFVCYVCFCSLPPSLTLLLCFLWTSCTACHAYTRETCCMPCFIQITHMKHSCHTHARVIFHIWMSHVTHTYIAWCEIGNSAGLHSYVTWLIHVCDIYTRGVAELTPGHAGII